MFSNSNLVPTVVGWGPSTRNTSINRDRGLHGKPAITPRIKTYEEEKDHLDLLGKGAGETFKFRLDLYDRVISGLSEMEDDLV